jgi:glucokinase
MNTAPDPSSLSRSFPWLVADIGGTNARFGLVHEPGGDVTQVRSLKGRDFPSPQAAALAYLDAELPAGQRIGRAALAVAAPVDDEPIQLTNSQWLVSHADIAGALGVSCLRLLNDFEALALSLPRLRAPRDITPFGPGVAQQGRPKAIVGPGTGLGVASCVPVGERWVALAAEGGHVTVAAADDFEASIIGLLRREFPHLSAERLLSGTGLPNLYRAVCEVRGDKPELLLPAEITRRALSDAEPAALATLDTFCAMLGSFAGNVALTVGARGGVYVGGGIAQILGDRLVNSRFRERFESKGRMSPYLAQIETSLLVSPHAALAGAAAALA